MANIIPLDGFFTAKAVGELQSIDTEISEIKGMKFFTVDTSAKRNDVQNNKTRVRLFSIVSVPEKSDERIKSFVGKKMYCVCFEKEDANNVIVDKNSGEKLFIMPLADMLAEYVENN